MELGVTRASMVVDASPWMARSWPLQEAGVAQRICARFQDGTFQYSHERLGIAANLASIPNQDLKERRLTWSLEGPLSWALEGSLSNEFITGVALLYLLNTEFIEVWNQLAKRTTLYSDYIPAFYSTSI